MNTREMKYLTSEIRDKFSWSNESHRFIPGYKAKFRRWMRRIQAEAYDRALQDAQVSPVPRNPYRDGVSSE